MMNENERSDPLDEVIRHTDPASGARSWLDADLVLEYLNGRLSEEARAAFQRRLADDSGVRREVQEIVRELASLDSSQTGSALERVDPAAIERLSARIHRASPEFTKKSMAAPPGHAARWWSAFWTPTAGYGLAALILLFVAFGPAQELLRNNEALVSAQSFQLRASAPGDVLRGSNPIPVPIVPLHQERELFCLTVWLPDGVSGVGSDAQVRVSQGARLLFERGLAQLLSVEDGFESLILCLPSSELEAGILTVNAKGTPSGAPIFTATMELE